MSTKTKKRQEHNVENEETECLLSIADKTGAAVRELIEITKAIETTRSRYSIDEELDVTVESMRVFGSDASTTIADKVEEIRLRAQESLSKIIIDNTYAIYLLLSRFETYPQKSPELE